MPEQEPKKSRWAKLWDWVKGVFSAIVAFFKKASWWVIALIIAVVVVALCCLVPILLKKFNIGGFLSSLFRKNDPLDGKVKIRLANTIDSKRVDEAGKEIPQGKPDDKGYTQWKVVELVKSNNPFRDKSKIRIVTTETQLVPTTAPDGTQLHTSTEEPVEKTIQLPKGVKDSDVARILKIQPDAYVVEVTDASKIRVTDVINDLP